MNHQVIQTDRVDAGIGPSSQAIVAKGTTIYVSGQVAWDNKTQKIVSPEDVVAQTHQVMKNIEAVLQEAGARLQDIVRATIFLADMNDYSKVNEAYGNYFDHAIAPARVCVEVSRLWEDVKIEIDCIAVLPET
ncbi:MAG: Rid family detoxifying hydrolase [Crocosphaera sp.]|nr:Rid family detoxifying hydrolase [Crocosphaera sp.]